MHGQVADLANAGRAGSSVCFFTPVGPTRSEEAAMGLDDADYDMLAFGWLMAQVGRWWAMPPSTTSH